MDRKGQLGTLQGIVLSLVVIGVLIGATFMILADFQEEAGDVTNTVTNETGKSFNSTGSTVNFATAPDFGAFTVTAARNGSSGLAIASGNYTVNSTSGVVRNATATVWSNVHLDYTYSTDNTAAREITTVTTAMTKVPAFLGLIVLIAIIAVIVGLIFNAFPGAKGGT